MSREKMLYRIALEHLAEPTVVLDSQLHLRHCNAAARTWLAEDAAAEPPRAGQPARKVLPWLREELERFLIRGEVTTDCPVMVEGRSVPLRVTLSRLQEEGRMLGVMVGWRDLNDGRPLDLQLLASQRASEDRFQRLMEQAPFAIAMFSRDGWLVQVNPAWAHLWEVPRPAELLHRFNLLTDPQSQAVGYALAFRQALQGETVDVGEVEVKPFAPRNDSQRLALHSRVYPLTGSDGQVHTVVTVHEDISERKRLERALKNIASTDSLTGACNRLHFMERAEREFARYRRYRGSLSLLMLDLDHFKHVNDTHGHHAGDGVLRQMVQRCRQLFRETDLLGRLGGEEFAVLLPETALAQAQITAERLCREMAEQPIVLEGQSVAVTVSIGVAQAQADDRSLEELLRRADQALYDAKHGGRNRVNCAA